MVRTLVQLGYAVSEARDGPSALRLIESGATVDLLFTDIVMPNGMLGPQLARRALALRPGLRVLFTSGNPVMAGASLDEIRRMGTLPGQAVERVGPRGGDRGRARGDAVSAVRRRHTPR